MKTNDIKFSEHNDLVLTRWESDILYALYLEPFVNQRILSEITGYSLGIVSRSIKSLIKFSMLDERIQLTASARNLIRSMSPTNAIILAAGLGMRMVPINMSTPKALMEVNGERLIDRLITQLHDVGINDITIVVGFMKDSFEYLIDEYGVELVVNEEYSTKNNISSLSRVLGRLSNTYILPCDIWCDKNPFHRNELYSWYMVSDIIEASSNVRVNRKMELVKVPMKSGGNGMIGITYLTKDKSKVVKHRIDGYCNNPEYDDKFWEEALYDSDRMIVQARVVHYTDVVEINTYEQLRDLDSDSNQLKSDALKIIAKVLNCKNDDIKDIEVLKKGMTNRSFLFSVKKTGGNGGRYIMRIPGEGTDLLIDRAAEADVYRVIQGKELCDDPIYINPDNGYKITKYIENAGYCDADNPKDLRVCMKKLRRFHSLKLTVPHTFDLFERIEFYESLWDGNSSIYKDYMTTKANVLKLKDYIDSHRLPYQLTHIDAVSDNFLFDLHEAPDSELDVQLTDWEYAGMQDPHVDIAMFCVYALYNKQQVDRLIDIYFEADGGCAHDTRVKIYCYIAVSGLIWSNWCEYKRNLGVEFGEYSLRQYRFAKDYYSFATKEMSSDKREIDN